MFLKSVLLAGAVLLGLGATGVATLRYNGVCCGLGAVLPAS